MDGCKCSYYVCRGEEKAEKIGKALDLTLNLDLQYIFYRCPLDASLYLYLPAGLGVPQASPRKAGGRVYREGSL